MMRPPPPSEVGRQSRTPALCNALNRGGMKRNRSPVFCSGQHGCGRTGYLMARMRRSSSLTLRLGASSLGEWVAKIGELSYIVVYANIVANGDRG